MFKIKFLPFLPDGGVFEIKSQDYAFKKYFNSLREMIFIENIRLHRSIHKNTRKSVKKGRENQRDLEISETFLPRPFILNN